MFGFWTTKALNCNSILIQSLVKTTLNQFAWWHASRTQKKCNTTYENFHWWCFQLSLISITLYNYADTIYFQSFLWFLLGKQMHPHFMYHVIWLIEKIFFYLHETKKKKRFAIGTQFIFWQHRMFAKFFNSPTQKLKSVGWKVGAIGKLAIMKSVW